MHTSSLERRLEALEQRHERVSVMHILFGAAHDHYGYFLINPGGGRTRFEERKLDESWESFRNRMDEFAVGVLRLITFQPTDDAGHNLHYTEPQEEHEND